MEHHVMEQKLLSLAEESYSLIRNISWNEFSKKYENDSIIGAIAVMPGMVIFDQKDRGLIFIQKFDEISPNYQIVHVKSHVIFHNGFNVEFWKNSEWTLFDDRRYGLVDNVAAIKESVSRKDYCYDCCTDDLYWQAMAAKCSYCNRVILGG